MIEFITLTTTDGEPIRINKAHVTFYTKSASDKSILIIGMVCGKQLYALESPAQLDDLMGQV